MKKLFCFFSFLILFLFTSCGQNNAYGDCGDPSIGQFTCNSDSIYFQYNYYTFKNTHWYNSYASGESPAIFGPYLSLHITEQEHYRFLQVSGLFTVRDYYSTPDYATATPITCINYGNQHEHLFDLVLVGKCYGKPFILSRRTVHVLYARTDMMTGNACAVVVDTGAANVSLTAEASPLCSDFELQVRQVLPRFLSDSGFYAVTPRFLQIVGVK